MSAEESSDNRMNQSFYDELLKILPEEQVKVNEPMR